MLKITYAESVLLHMYEGWCFSGKTGPIRIYKFLKGMDKPPVEKKVLKQHLKQLVKAGHIKYINNEVWVLTEEGSKVAKACIKEQEARGKSA